MIPGDIEKVDIKCGDHVLEIVVREVPATDDEIDVTKVTCRNEVV